MILTVTANAAIDKRYVVEHLDFGEVNRVKECDYVAGGKGLNVSKTAVIAGAQVKATGFAAGHAGAYILEEVEKSKITADFVQVSGESRSCINIFDEKTGKQTEFLEPGVSLGQTEEQEFYIKYRKLIEDCTVVVISGSVPKGIGTDFYPNLIQIAKNKGKKVIVDTSGNLLPEVIKAKPDLIKPNIDEIRFLTGKKIETEQELRKAGKELQKNKIPWVVISLGKDGSLLFTDQGVYAAKVPRVNAKNTVGCGDCMTAGFAIGMERGMSPEEALRFASAASAASAMREETGFFVKADMDMLYEKIQIIKKEETE